MKKINLTAFLLTLTTLVLSQEVDWKVGLTPIPPGENSDFGTATADPINFYTNGTKKMTLDPDGNLQLNGSLDIGQGLLFNSESVLRSESYTSGSTTGNYFMLGKGALANPGTVFVGPCGTPNANGWTVTNGGLISGAFGMPSPNLVNAYLKMFASPTNGNGYLELEGLNNVGSTNALFINANCGRNTNINTGAGGVYMGNFVNMKSHLEIGDPTTGITAPSNNIALDITTHAGTGMRFTTNTDAMNLITVENNSNSIFKNTFKVQGDGKTEISTENTDAFVVRNLNYSNNVSFNIGSDGKTDIFTYNSKALSIWSQNTGVENFSFNTNGSIDIKTTVSNLTDNVISVTDNSNSNKNFQVKRSGKTIIGNLTQTSGNHSNAMLTVNGKAVAQEVIVTQLNWADFVFANDYKLMPIAELETFYLSQKHLPNVPTTEQIKENGNNVGETDALLLQKIEELTLYIVDQQKQIDNLKLQIKNK